MYFTLLFLVIFKNYFVLFLGDETGDVRNPDILELLNIILLPPK